MSIEIIKDIIKVEEIIGTQDIQPLVETQVYLNTNKQEIESILWVEGRVEISNTKPLKDRLLVNGKVKFNIVYKSMDEEENINTLDTVKEFKEEVDFEGIGENMETIVKSNIDYIEYELDDNSIDLRAVVNLSITIAENREIEVIQEIEGNNDLQFLEETIRYKEIYGQETSYANVKDTIVVGENKAAIDKVIRFNVTSKELQTLVTDDRLVVSAEAKISMIYLGNNEINYLNESLPFNHFIEIPGIEKSSLGEVKLEVIEGIYEILEDEAGELRLIDLEITILVNGKVYDYRVRPLVVDVYSTKEILNFEKEEIKLLENVESLSHEEELNVDIAIDAAEILDIKEDYNILDKRILEEGIVIEGLLTVDLFYIERSTGQIRNFKDHFQHKANVYYEGSFDGEALYVDTKLGDITYDINQEMLSIDNMIRYDINLNKEKTINGIKIIEETGQLIDLNNRSSITIYIVQKGDILWDIAKRYNSTIEDILSSNNLESSYEINVGDKIIIEKNIDDDLSF